MPKLPGLTPYRTLSPKGFTKRDFESNSRPSGNFKRRFMKIVWVFKTWLLGQKNVSREIEIYPDNSLYSFAEAIVNAYNFDFDHAFGFFSNIGEASYLDSERSFELFTDMPDVEPTGAGSVEKTKIKEAWKQKGDRMLFLFDYGDEWKFVVELIGLKDKDSKVKYPNILKKIGKAPKQY